MDRKLRAIVFDMGNVLMTFDGPTLAARFTSTPEDTALLNDAVFGSTSWALLDSGTISYETMARVAAAHLPERLHPNLTECLEHWPEQGLRALQRQHQHHAAARPRSRDAPA